MDVLPVLRAVRDEKIVSSDCPVAKRVQSEASRLLEGENTAVMEDVCNRLSAKLSALLPTKDKRFFTESFKQNAWSAFVKARISCTTDLWSQVYKGMGLSFEQPLLSQRVNRKLFERLLVSRLRERLPETARKTPFLFQWTKKTHCAMPLVLCRSS